ncbi:ABC-three component system protein [Actinomycetaceae bacterium L2_0104]
MIDSAWKAWYRAQHDLRCRASGETFESYATTVLARLHADYLNPDPMGSLGDGGCDGLAENGTILYACYGQRATTGVDQKTKEKLEGDFARGCANWATFTTWRFVTNAPFGPTPATSLVTLRKQHEPGTERPLTLELWRAPDDLWWKAVNTLTPAQLDEIIPGVPHAQDVELVDLVELIESLTAINGGGADRLDPIQPVPSTKMDFNQLPETTRAEFNEGRLLSPRIDRWFTEQADPSLRDEKAQRFRAIYQEARQTTTDVREIVRYIYGALGGQDFDMSAKRANAVYAVTAYFFDSCDIFEEPPSDYAGGESRDVASN